MSSTLPATASFISVASSGGFAFGCDFGFALAVAFAFAAGFFFADFPVVLPLAMRHRIAICLLLAACKRSAPEMDRERAGALFSEVVIDTAPGLSGLAVDDTDALWTVAERDKRIYRITLAGAKPTIETFTVTDVPDGMDLEGMAWLAPDKLALGTEGLQDGVASVLLADVRGPTVAVTRRIDLPSDRVGVHLEANHGAEGICGIGDRVVVAIETVGVDAGKRWAPIVVLDGGEITHTYRLWLTTQTGKLSGLDCRMRGGKLELIAIERHFEVTKILTFALPDAGDITPHEALDLGPVLNNALNLEGIAWRKDGSVIAVNDNQWKTISGPSELLVFKPQALH